MERKIIKEKIDDIKNLFQGREAGLPGVKKFKIDLLSESDIQNACILEKECHDQEPSSGVQFEGEAGFNELLRVFTKMQNQEEVLVLKIDNKYLGHVGFQVGQADSSVGLISFLSIDPSIQNKKCSLPLLLASVKRLEEQKCKYVQASTSNFKLIKLTESLGLHHKDKVNYRYNNL